MSRWRWAQVALAFTGAMSQRVAMANYLGLPALRVRGCADVPAVSIIIPARDEAANLPGLLHDLAQLRYPLYEVIVVDDGSSDATAAIARALGAQVIDADRPPDAVGKAHACHIGARTAHSDWLLFTDADTRHAPESLGAAIREALDRNLDALSVFPEQRYTGLWDRLVIPFLYASYFSAVRPATVNQSPAQALLNGQYLLIRRDVYDIVGGHALTSLVEDVELAIRLQRAGHQPGVARAAGLVSVAMYRDWTSLAEGFRKNSFAFLALQPARGARVAAATMLASLAGPALFIAWNGAGRERLAALGVLALAMHEYGRWTQLSGGRRAAGLLQPLAATASLVIVLHAAHATLFRRAVTWKGRSYAAR